MSMYSQKFDITEDIPSFPVHAGAVHTGRQKQIKSQSQQSMQLQVSKFHKPKPVPKRLPMCSVISGNLMMMMMTIMYVVV